MPDERLETYLGARSRLLRHAYRFLGSASEAEDAVQEAWLRYAKAECVEDGPAFLTRIVGNLCLDRLRSAQHRREHYVGPWLPEPLVERAGTTETDYDAALDISYAVMCALERLSPLERAALFLHDMFDMSFEEVGAAIDRSPATCRKLASRARQAIRAEKPRYPASEADLARFEASFVAATRTGDVSGLMAVLSADVELIPDGGGKVSAANRIVVGARAVARLLVGLAGLPGSADLRFEKAWVNGGQGLVIWRDGSIEQVMGFDVDEEGLIGAIYEIRNPEKLEHLQPAPADGTGADMH
ncbi:RNA polymerase sigma factor SigJ [Cucumibacter marinus]|uniref:RNA polymerase sigma factor SigJ n=1 Tax=Cucumibacter marinus TaxID=1121252 RepID=UPI00041A74C6|nr:RNA polymerase sigma factor SigJ [Cucumibacter marinus]